MKHKALWSVVSSLSLLGCDSVSDDGAKNGQTGNEAALKSGLFLEDADLAKANTKLLGEGEIWSGVNDVDDVYNSKPDQTPEEADKALDDCLAKGIGGALKLDGNTWSYESSAKSFDCTSKSSSKISYSSVQYVFKAQCEEVNEAAKTDIGKSVFGGNSKFKGSLCAKGKESRTIIQTKVAASVGGLSETKTFEVKTELVSNTSLPGFAPCVEKGKVSDGCVKTTVNTSDILLDGRSTKTVEKTIFTAKALKASDASQKYYESGTADLVLTDWKGVVTYSGAKVAPTWTMTKGTVTKTGTFGAFPTTGSELSPRTESSTETRMETQPGEALHDGGAQAVARDVAQSQAASVKRVLNAVTRRLVGVPKITQK
jgi:hypothetical protein